MITSLSIENLRGIRSGELRDLRPLTILTGANGCGKSTVLDALLIATGAYPGEAVGRAIQRHPGTRNGARWLVYGAQEPRNATVTIHSKTGDGLSTTYKCSLEWQPLNGALDERFGSLAERSGSLAEPRSVIRYRIEGGISAMIVFGADNRHLSSEWDVEEGSQFSKVRLVDPGLPVSLNTAYSEAVRQGRKRNVIDLLRVLVPDIDGIEILTEDDGTPALYITTQTGSVPVSLSGDGVQSFLQIALELAARPGGLVLVEEPEVYQHPRAIGQTAQAIWASVRRGVQTVVTTHSLELIDRIVGAAAEAELDKLALFNLHLEQGVLKSSRYSGKDMEFARSVVENDLR